MKVKIYSADEPGFIAGEMEIPADIMTAAQNLSEWLEKNGDHSLILYGVGLRSEV